MPQACARLSIKAAGAIITEDLDITVKKGPFGRMRLLALLNKADSASPTAANFEPSCTIEVAVPVELSNVLMHIAMGDKSGTLKVAKPATAETVTSALVEAGWIENKDGADKASITFANMEFGLADIRTLHLLIIKYTEWHLGCCSAEPRLPHGGGTVGCLLHPA